RWTLNSVSIGTQCIDVHRQLQLPEYINSYMADYSPVIALADIEDSQGLTRLHPTSPTGTEPMRSGTPRTTGSELAYTDATRPASTTNHLRTNRSLR
ncbi:MAG: hypothetical protein V8R14_00560, partial [Clostridia bacterium]